MTDEQLKAQAKALSVSYGPIGLLKAHGTQSTESETHTAYQDLMTSEQILLAEILLGLVGFIILMLHGFVPSLLYRKFDLCAFHHRHTSGQGTPRVRKNTALGGAFSLAYIVMIVAIAVALIGTNGVIEQSSIVLRSEDPPMSNIGK